MICLTLQRTSKFSLSEVLSPFSLQLVCIIGVLCRCWNWRKSSNPPKRTIVPNMHRYGISMKASVMLFSWPGNLSTGNSQSTSGGSLGRHSDSSKPSEPGLQPRNLPKGMLWWGRIKELVRWRAASGKWYTQPRTVSIRNTRLWKTKPRGFAWKTTRFECWGFRYNRLMCFSWRTKNWPLVLVNSK